MTYKEISEKYNVEMSLLTRRVNILKVRGVFKGRNVTFTKGQVEQLLGYDPKAYDKRRSMINHPRKLKIIEFYLKRKSGRKVAEFLNISRPIVDATIREYNKTGFLVVESRLNKEEYEEENVNLV